jgi:competence protein ComEC
MIFAKHVFAYLFICFAIGVLVGIFSLNAAVLLFIPVIFLMLSFWRYARKKIKFSWFLVYAALVFQLLGWVSVKEFNERHFEVAAEEKAQWVLKVVEIQKKPEKEWFKGIALIGERKQDQLFFENKKLVFFTNSKKQFEKNDVLLVQGKSNLIVNKNNPGEFNLRLYWKGKGIDKILFFQDEDYHFLDRGEADFLSRVFQSVSDFCHHGLSKFLEGEELAVAKALILGDKSMLDSELRNSFSNTGAMHVLAVSGLHVGIVAQILMYLSQFLSRWVTKKRAVLTVVILLWAYALLTGFSPSVVRSVLMFSLLIVAQISGRNYESINVLFFAALVSLLFNPYLIVDVGFQLSYGAMLGIFLFYGPISSLFTIENRYIKFLWDGTAVGLAAQCMTTPLTLYYFHQFPNFFAITNIGLMVFSGVALGFGIATIAFSRIPLVNQMIGGLFFAILWLMISFIQWIESWPGAVAKGFEPSLFLVFGLTVVFAVLILPFFSRQLKWVGASGLMVLMVILSYSRHEKLTASHVCVFNHNQLAISLKNGQELYVLYDASKPKNREKLNLVLDGYSKIFPVKRIHFLEVNNRNFTFKKSNKLLQVKKTDFGYELTVNQETKYIVFSENHPTLIGKSNLMFMPWIDKKGSLLEGAKIFNW